MQGSAIRRVLRRGEVLQGDAEILPPAVAARVHELAQEWARCAAGAELREAGQRGFRWEEVHQGAERTPNNDP